MNFTGKTYLFEPGSHHNKKIIWVRVKKDNALIAFLRSQTKAWWSASVKAWYVSDSRYNRELFGLSQPAAGKTVLNKIHLVNLPALQRLQEHLVLKGCSQNTVRTYTVEFAQLLYVLKSDPVSVLTPERLRSYFLYCHNTLKLSENEIHSRINAVKFYFEQVRHQPKMFFDIPRPKKQLQLPKMLSQSEVQKILSVTHNTKHNLMLKLCYGMGCA